MGSENPNENETGIDTFNELGNYDEFETGTPPHECDSFHLLNKKTASFRCLQQMLLSSSAFMHNKDFMFPPLQDPGINDAFNYVEPEPVYDDVAAEKYVNLCKELKIFPFSRIVHSLPGDTLNLKYYGLTPKQMHALTETLKINSRVQILNLQDNWMNKDVSQMLSTMLEENTSIRILNLRECRIGEEGAEKLGEALSISQFLTELDLSFNNLGDKGITKMKAGLCESPNLRVLNLSHNNLTEECVEALEKILQENTLIHNLDLSWNSFCTGPGNKKLFGAMKLRDNLKNLNISWNGIATKPAVTPLSSYLKASENLEHLDISNNRLEGTSLRSVRAGIFKNQSLKSVKIGNNIYNPDEAFFVASLLTTKPNDHPLKSLDMENMVFDRKALPLLSRIKYLQKTIKYGCVLGNYTIKGPDINKLLFQRCKYLLEKPKKKKLKKDFGHFVLALPDENIPKDQFATMLKKKKIKKLDPDLVKELCNRFMAKNQKIDCVAMKNSFMKYYPDATLPPPPPKKGKKGKKGKGKGKGKDNKEAEGAAPQEAVAEVPQESKCVVPLEAGIEEKTEENADGEAAPPPPEGATEVVEEGAKNVDEDAVPAEEQTPEAEEGNDNA